MYVRVLEQFSSVYRSSLSGLERGFDPARSYKVHKIESYSESGTGFVVLVNDAQEIWWVDNRHVRVTHEEDFLPSRSPETDRYLA